MTLQTFRHVCGTCNSTCDSVEKMREELKALRVERDQARELAKLDHFIIEELRAREKYLADLLGKSGTKLRELIAALTEAANYADEHCVLSFMKAHTPICKKLHAVLAALKE